MTSLYLTRKPRSQAQVLRKRHMEVLTELAVHMRGVATMHENSTQNWRSAELPNRQAAALEWVLDEIDREATEASREQAKESQR